MICGDARSVDNVLSADRGSLKINGETALEPMICASIEVLSIRLARKVITS
jgi:hypothetical protein